MNQTASASILVSTLVFTACAPIRNSPPLVPPITDAQVDQHWHDLPWLLAAVRRVPLTPRQSQFCAYLIMVQTCHPGMTLSQVAKAAGTQYWITPMLDEILLPAAPLRQRPFLGGTLRVLKFSRPGEMVPSAMWFGISEDIPIDVVYFALTHPDSDVALHVRITGVYFDEAAPFMAEQSDP